MTPKGISHTVICQNCKIGSYSWNVLVVLLNENLNDLRDQQTDYHSDILPAIVDVK